MSYDKYKKYNNNIFKNNKNDKNNGKTKRNIIITIVVSIIVIAFIVVMNPTHIEALEGYTEIKEQLIGTYDLVPEDGYYAGTGTLNGIVHARFEAQKDGKLSDTVDVTKKFFEVVNTQNTLDANIKALNGKVKTYKRTYKKGTDIKTHFYYVLYVDNSSKVKACGTLDTDNDDDSDD